MSSYLRTKYLASSSIVIFPHQVSPLVVVARVGVWVVLLVFIVAPINTIIAALRTIPKEVQQCPAIIAEFLLHHPHCLPTHIFLLSSICSGKQGMRHIQISRKS